MNKEKNVRVVASTRLHRIRSEYEEFLSAPPSSLQNLFEPGNFSFRDFCRDFNPHPESKVLKSMIEDYGREKSIWLPNAKDHITCALYLYPAADFHRMFTMMKNLTLGFYLNDVMGRDLFKFLNPADQAASSAIIRNMAALDETLSVPAGAHSLEETNVEILGEFKSHSPEDWFSNFLRVYCYHIGITHADGDTASQGHIPGIHEYMERRCHLGGVHHILLWIEYSGGQFLDWALLRELDVSAELRRLHWISAAFAGLSNDHFSFEKEVIDSDSDSNLLMIIALNHPELSLKGIIDKSSEIVRNLLLEMLTTLRSIRQKLSDLGDLHKSTVSSVEWHLASIERCMQATWLWQAYSGRYKRPKSIWQETTLQD
ncbi:MAG: terpene synthase family protein [Puia sp.]|nr:terpene synthase family protein [Puia sp.]